MSDFEPSARTVKIRDLRWKTHWLFVGGAFLAAWYCVRFIDPEWVAGWPVFVWLVVAGLLPQLFMLVFPFFTHEDLGTQQLRLPRLKRWLIELAVAIPLVLVVVISLSLLAYLYWGLSRGGTFTPDAIDNLARSRNPQLVYSLAVLSFTLVPFTEEIFFRGFLYNALRHRMPTIAAGIIQSLIFGFCHFFGTTHAVVASILGIVITAVYEWRKTLITPILMHAGINAISAIGTIALMHQYAGSPMMGVFGANEGKQCLVSGIVPDSPAAEAGIMVGDVVTAFDGDPLVSFSELFPLVQSRQPGDVVTLELLRDGEPITVHVTLRRRGYSTQQP